VPGSWGQVAAGGGTSPWSAEEVLTLTGTFGMMLGRSLALGASTPWKRIRCSLGRGTSAASRCCIWMSTLLPRKSITRLMASPDGHVCTKRSVLGSHQSKANRSNCASPPGIAFRAADARLDFHQSPDTLRAGIIPCEVTYAEREARYRIPHRLRRLKDPLYGYVHLSQLEHQVIQSPLMLRLHHVHQNSTAFLTYPTANATRFAHSAGAMHLVGLITVRALHAMETGSTIEDLLVNATKQTVNEDLHFSDIFNELSTPGRAHYDSVANDGLYRLNPPVA
jgi:hypothetical protein